MRPKASECRGRARTAAQAAGTAAAVLALAGLGVATPVAPAAAQGSDVAYVEAVSGRVIAFAQGSPALLDVLDIVDDRTRLDLPANSQLRLCHHRLRKLVALKGPLRASVTAAGVTAENGGAIVPSSEACSAPVISTFQGGFVSRSLALGTTKVPLRPSIKVVNAGTKPIRRVALWDAAQQKILATFERNVARPGLDDGRSYLLVVERGDGSELKMILEASAGAPGGPLIVVAR